MGCNNCGKSSLRHSPKVVVSGDMDKNVPAAQNLEPAVAVRPGKSFTSEEGTTEVRPAAMTSQEAFEVAKSYTFDQIIEKQARDQQASAAHIESMYRQMTEHMRHFHIVSLLSVANYENLAMPGVSPDQAVIALKEALDREDFSDINMLYPSLKEKVAARYNELMQKRIVL